MLNILHLRKSVIVWIALWWLAFIVLSISRFNAFQILNIVGFLSLILIPGWLTVTAFKISGLEFWGHLGLIVGLSLLELMTLGLLGNIILPFAGITRPVDSSFILGEITLLVSILLLINWKRLGNMKFLRVHCILFDTVRDGILAFFPALFVVVSVFGAIRLNNDASGILTLGMLIGIAMYSAILIRYSKHVGPNVIPIALFFLSLSLLFMTSLRGWYTTGHDIQREYRVFELVRNNGFWSIASFRDAYNACMSITILPTIFSTVLKFSDPYVYKVFFQIIFSIVPGIVFLIAKRYVSQTVALLSVVYFISFPTFFGDMPMLNRQEIAFVFLSLMFYIIFETRVSLFLRRILFTLLGIGMIFSHYSTTYTVLALLFFLYITTPWAIWFSFLFKKKSLLSRSAVSVLRFRRRLANATITFWMVVVLVSVSFLWSSVLTDTSSNSFARVISSTIKAMREVTASDSHSGDVLYSLFSWKKLDKYEVVKGYQKNVVDPARKNSEADTFYDTSVYGAYDASVIDDSLMPLTALGQKLASHGFDVVSFNYFFRQGSAKMLQILIVVGFLFVVGSNKFTTKPINDEYFLLVIGSLILVLSQIILPVLSIEYGLLRAFQQSLIFLGIFIVIGSYALMSKFGSTIQSVFAGALAIIFFLSSTGVFTQILGGYPPQLHLNNDGLYYDIYYLHSTEIEGIQWLQSNLNESGEHEYQSEVQTDRYSSLKAESIIETSTANDIYPALIRKNSYVYLGYTNVQKHQSTISYNGNLISYMYPLQFLDDTKDLIYDNGGAKVFK
jgi:uncharacterized membrane protein